MTFLSELQKLNTLQKLHNGMAAAPYPAALSGIPTPLWGIVGRAIRPTGAALFITPGEEEAEKVYDALRGVCPPERVALLPAADLVFEAVDASANEANLRRRGVLDGILSGRVDTVVTTLEGFISLCPPPDSFSEGKLTLSIGEAVGRDRLTDFLTDNGFVRFDSVEGVGSYSVRGSIVDVYPPGFAQPVRIDFFDDEIDRLTLFDPLTQKTTENIQTATLTAAGLPGEGKRAALLADALEQMAKKEKNDTVKDRLLREIETLREGLPLSGRDRYRPIEYGGRYTLCDYLPSAQIFVCGYEGMAELFSFFSWQVEEDCKRLTEEQIPYAKQCDFYLSEEDFTALIGEKRAIFLSMLPLSAYHGKLSALETLSVQEDALTRGEPGIFISEIVAALESGMRVYCCTGGKESAAARLRDSGLPLTSKPQPDCITLTEEALAGDYRIEGSLLLIGERGAKKNVKKRASRPAGEKIRSFADINPGDYVVHIHHGIGVYRGIKRVENHGIIKDYLAVGYEGGDTLYIPTTQLDMLGKYTGSVGESDGPKVKLSRMGSGAWEKAKQKAKSAARILAKELIELYAKRQKAQGHAFSPDTDWQRQFEDNFPYEETPDQIRCIEEIKADMEKPNPMERLLCGDVGFGKTEVALRAVFKAVMDSKQAAILVPTTILSMQHLNTVVARFRGFPIKAQVLSRFRTKKQQEEILRKLRRGEIDVIIGTHRLLQKDVVFKDLGLLVVDEEQRFGVRHKEKIKEMSVGVDVLTLSATPIPRTLNMALSGIRDLSIIEEAPADRHPVATYVLPFDRGVVLGAIRRELKRHGCVYYLKNNIEALDHIAARIAEDLPTARVAVAHGKMTGTELEKIWQQVLDREVDVLLCTTIIETGIDVSFANTLIIEDADRMGLAQLHQIRGRIGRSATRAYAYLTYRPEKVPSEIAAKRLMTVKEFTAFGSGLKIAMRDLELRGAGSVLGERQHGHLGAIGYDLYMRILQEAIAEEQGEPTAQKTDCQMDIALSAYIPNEYIESEEQRIELYKKIAAIETAEDLSDITDELCDRFGEPPAPTENLMRIARLRGSARVSGVSEIKQKGSCVLIFLEAGNPDRLFAAVKEYKGRLRLSNGARPYLTYYPKDGEDLLSALQGLVDFISLGNKVGE